MAQKYGCFQPAQPDFPSCNPQLFNQLVQSTEWLQMNKASALNGRAYSSLAASERLKYLGCTMASPAGLPTTNSQQSIWAMFQAQGLQLQTSQPPVSSVNSSVLQLNQYYGEQRLGCRLGQEPIQSHAQLPWGNNQGQVCGFPPPSAQSCNAECGPLWNMSHSDPKHSGDAHHGAGFFPPTVHRSFPTNPPYNQAFNHLHHNTVLGQTSNVTNQQLRETNRQSFYHAYSVSSVPPGQHNGRQVQFSASNGIGNQPSGWKDPVYHQSESASVPVSSFAQSFQERRLLKEVSFESCIRNRAKSTRSLAKNKRSPSSLRNSSKKTGHCPRPSKGGVPSSVRQDNYETTQGQEDRSTEYNHENLDDSTWVKHLQNSLSAGFSSTEPVQSNHDQRSLEKSTEESAVTTREQRMNCSQFEQMINNSSVCEKRHVDDTTTSNSSSSPDLDLDQCAQTGNRPSSQNDHCAPKKDVAKAVKEKDVLLKRLINESLGEHSRSVEDLERRAERLLATNNQIMFGSRTLSNTITDPGKDLQRHTGAASALNCCQCARNPLSCHLHNPLQSPVKHEENDNNVSSSDPNKHPVPPEKENEQCQSDNGTEGTDESVWEMLETDVDIMKQTYENSATENLANRNIQQTICAKRLKNMTDLDQVTPNVDSTVKDSSIPTLDTLSHVFAGSSFSDGITENHQGVASASDNINRESSTANLDKQYIDYYHTCVNCKKSFSSYLELNDHLSVHLNYEKDETCSEEKGDDCVQNLDKKNEERPVKLSHKPKDNLTLKTTSLLSVNEQVPGKKDLQNSIVPVEKCMCSRYDPESRDADRCLCFHDAYSGNMCPEKSGHWERERLQDSYPVQCAVEEVRNADLDNSSSSTCYSPRHAEPVLSQSLNVKDSVCNPQNSSLKFLSARQESLTPNKRSISRKRQHADFPVHGGKKSRHQDNVMCSVPEKKRDCAGDNDLPVIHKTAISNPCRIQSDSISLNGDTKFHSHVGKHKSRTSEPKYKKPSGIHVQNMCCSHEHKQKRRHDSGSCMKKIKVSDNIVSTTHKNHDSVESASGKQQSFSCPQTCHQISDKQTSSTTENISPKDQRAKALKIVRTLTSQANNTRGTDIGNQNRHKVDKPPFGGLKVQKSKVFEHMEDITSDEETKQDREGKCASVQDPVSERHRDTRSSAPSDSSKKEKSCSAHVNLDGGAEKNCNSVSSTDLNPKVSLLESQPPLMTDPSKFKALGQNLAKSRKAQNIVNSLRNIFKNNAQLLRHKTVRENSLNGEDSTTINLATTRQHGRNTLVKAIETEYTENDFISKILSPKKIVEGFRKDTAYLQKNVGDSRNRVDSKSGFGQSECKKRSCVGMSHETGITFGGALSVRKKSKSDDEVSVKKSPIEKDSCQQTNHDEDLIFCVKCMTVFTKRGVYDEHDCCRKIDAEESHDKNVDMGKGHEQNRIDKQDRTKQYRCVKWAIDPDSGLSDIGDEEQYRKRTDRLKLKIVLKKKSPAKDKKKKRNRILSSRKKGEHIKLRISADKKKKSTPFDQTIFRCDQCDQSYSSRGGLLFHWQAVHKKSVG